MKDNHSEHVSIDDLFDFIGDLIDAGTEVHVVNCIDKDHVVEHVFIPEDDDEIDDDDDEIDEDDLPFDGFDDDDVCECDKLDCDVYACGDCNECNEDEWYPDDDDYIFGVPGIDHIVFSDPATIVFWIDGTKTVVKTTKGDKFERYMGFAAACLKKMFGSTSRARAVMESFAVEQLPKESKKKPVDLDKLSETIQEAIDEALG